MVCLFGIYTLTFYTTDNTVTNNNKMITLTPSKTLDRMENKKQGLYYIGSPDCPWCRTLVPLLINELPSSKKIYSINTHGKNFSKKDHYRLQRIYSAYYNDDLTIPFIVSINSKGNTITHVGTVPTHDAKLNDLTNREKTELIKIINKLITWAMN